MNFGTIKAINALLKRKGLKISDIDVYAEKIKNVGYSWLQEYDIKTILDIGASNGGFASTARKQFPESNIISFEPLNDSFEKLKSKFINDKKHFAYNLVLSDKIGELEFHENNSSGSSSILSMANNHIEAYPATAHSKKILVKSETLDNIFSTLPITPNILLKIDVQGAESMVLKGAVESLSKIKVLFIELSFVELYDNQWLFDDIYQFLRTLNFKLAGIENISQNLNNGQYLQMDAYFVNENTIIN
ncbi:MAG: hypothetical protein RL065_1661 [Bacteroidota bacterium]|jgi:FkbM family methyltransferase